MKVLKIGTKIKVGEDIPATIIGIAIYTYSIEYKIVFWDSRTRKTEWIEESEITNMAVEDKQNIGFK